MRHDLGVQHRRAKACLLTTTHPPNCFCLSDLATGAKNIFASLQRLRPLRYAVEDLRTPKAFGAWLEVGDQRFNSSEIQRLYEADDYPLRKAE